MADSQLFVVNCNYDPDSESYVLDKTGQEILDASESGKVVIVREPDMYDGYGHCYTFVMMYIQFDMPTEYSSYVLYMMGMEYTPRSGFTEVPDIGKVVYGIGEEGSLSDHPLKLSW